MQKTKIEWCDYTANPIKGICKMGCDYCYANAMYRRFRWDSRVRLDMDAFDGIEKIKTVKDGNYIRAKVFVCSTHDIFGYWIPENWIKAIIQKVEANPQHTFLFLTKNPQNAWNFAYPDNLWLGVTVESQDQTWRIKTLLQPEIKTKLKFVSFEPLQGQIDCDFVNYQTGEKISWFIIGEETGKRKNKTRAEYGWITHLLYQHADTPAFLKNNLVLLPGIERYQEYPKEI